MPRVLLAPTAIRDLDGIREPDLARLRQRILGLGRDARPHGVKKLEGPLHRIRAGDWRILYAIDDSQGVVTVLRVLRRTERTYKLA